jgi:glycosyltransferase involved in cell wall biosynthesis
MAPHGTARRTHILFISVNAPLPDPADAVVLVTGGSPDLAGHVAEGSPARSRVLAVSHPAELNAHAAGVGADVILLDGRFAMPAGWRERLCAAAYSGDTVATASPLTRRRLDGAAGVAVGEPVHPRVELGDPVCLYVRRTALQLLGPDALRGETLNEIVASVSVQALGAGLLNVLADDLFIEGAADSPPSPVADPLTASLAALDAHDDSTPLRAVTRVARAAARGLSVTLDGRSLNRSGGGTQRYVLELALALRRFTDVSLRVVLPPDPAPEAAAALARTPGIELVDYDAVLRGVVRTDLVHRPQQIFSDGDLNLLRLLGDRIVVTQQDLIGYHNPTYHATVDEWERYRRVTRVGLGAADGVVFFSEAALQDAHAEELVGPARCDVVGIALEAPFPVPPRAPAGFADADPGEFLICLGADYRHKNRPFALELLAALRAEHGFAGRLVFAGGHVAHGSSVDRERALLDGDPALAAAVQDLGPVDEAGRAWLSHHARAVIVPSVVEGFGLMPLEAAAAGVPCLFAPVSSLREVASPALATLVPWDASASAARVAPLLVGGPAREDHVTGLRADAARLNWESLAPRLVAVYERALRSPFRAGAVHAWQELERERALAEMGAAHDDLLAHLGPNQALARDDGFLTAAEQRGLLRVGARPGLARVTLAPFAALGRVGGSRGRSRTPDDRDRS